MDFMLMRRFVDEKSNFALRFSAQRPNGCSHCLFQVLRRSEDSSFFELFVRFYDGQKIPMTYKDPQYHDHTSHIDVAASEGSKIEKPNPTQEAAIFVVSGQVSISGTEYSEGEFVLLEDQDDEIFVNKCGRFIVLGGEKFEVVPYIHWNFVSFSKDRIEQAKEDWKNGRFPYIPDDNKEFIPL